MEELSIMKKIFLDLENHPLGMINRDFKKLKKSDFEIIFKFIEDHEHMNKHDFEFKLNRLFLDNKNPPKNWKIILQLLSITNSTHHINP